MVAKISVQSEVGYKSYYIDYAKSRGCLEPLRPQEQHTNNRFWKTGDKLVLSKSLVPIIVATLEEFNLKGVLIDFNHVLE